MLGTSPPGYESPARPPAYKFLSTLAEIKLSDFEVVRGYARFEPETRQRLKDLRDAIVAAARQARGTLDNFLVWAPPGTGKTSFVESVSHEAHVAFVEINLAKATEAECLKHLEDAIRNAPCICFLDEVDARPNETWPFGLFLPYLHPSSDAKKHLVFVLAGSTGTTAKAMIAAIASRPKGADLLSRVPDDHRHTIPPVEMGDHMLIFVQQLVDAAQAASHNIKEIEALALYYVLAGPRKKTARQLADDAVRAAGRVQEGDRLFYGHLFEVGEVTQYGFRQGKHAEELAGKWIRIYHDAQSPATIQRGRTVKEARLVVAHFHETGQMLRYRVRTEQLAVHDARLLTIRWVREVHQYLEHEWPEQASLFLGDFRIREAEWEERHADAVLRDIDVMVQASEEPLAHAYQDEIIQVLEEKLVRLESLIAR